LPQRPQNGSQLLGSVDWVHVTTFKELIDFTTFK
jgi:hypothetical protein